MSEFEGHTPGPWLFKWDTNGYPIIVDKHGFEIAEVFCDPDDIDPGVEVNAELIVAAPRLLEERDAARAQAEKLADVLRGIVGYVEPWQSYCDYRAEPDLRAAAKKANEALADYEKERGRLLSSLEDTKE